MPVPTPTLHPLLSVVVDQEIANPFNCSNSLRSPETSRLNQRDVTYLVVFFSPFAQSVSDDEKSPSKKSESVS